MPVFLLELHLCSASVLCSAHDCIPVTCDLIGEGGALPSFTGFPPEDKTSLFNFVVGLEGDASTVG